MFVRETLRQRAGQALLTPTKAVLRRTDGRGKPTPLLAQSIAPLHAPERGIFVLPTKLYRQSNLSTFLLSIVRTGG